MLAHDPLVAIDVAGVSLVRTHDARELGAALVGGAGHEARDRGGEGTAGVGVVGQPRCHEQRAEVRIADAQLTVPARGVADGLRREVGEADGDVHRGDDELHRTGEALGVERVVVLEEREQVQRGEVARGVVQAHVLEQGWTR
jgi:hypothetical protein